MGRIPLRLSLDVREPGARQLAAKRALPLGSDDGHVATSFNNAEQHRGEHGSPSAGPASAPILGPAITDSAHGTGLFGPGALQHASHMGSVASTGSCFGSDSSGSNNSSSSCNGSGASGGVSNGWARLRGGTRLTDGGASAAIAAAVPPPAPGPAAAAGGRHARLFGPLSGQALAEAALSTCSNAERQLHDFAAPPPAATAAAVEQPPMPLIRRPALALPYHLTRGAQAPPPQAAAAATGAAATQQHPQRQGGAALAALLHQRQLLAPGAGYQSPSRVSAVDAPPPRSPQHPPRTHARSPSPPRNRRTPPPAGLAANLPAAPTVSPAAPQQQSRSTADRAGMEAAGAGEPASPFVAPTPPAPAADAEPGTQTAPPPPPDPRSQLPPPATPQQPLMAVLRDLARMSANQLTDSFDATRRHRTESMYARDPAADSPPQSRQRPRGSGTGMLNGTGGTRRRASDSNAYLGPTGAGDGAAVSAAALAVAEAAPSSCSQPLPTLPASITANAMRAVAGLQELDEYSLVAAARQRLQRVVAGQGRSLSVQPGGAGGSGGPAAAAGAAVLGGASRRGGGMGAGVGPQLSLRSLLTGSVHAPLQASRSLNALPLLLAARHSAPSGTHGSDPDGGGAPHRPASPPSPTTTSLAAALISPTGAAARADSKSFLATTAPGTPTLPPVTLPARSGGSGGGGGGASFHRSFTARSAASSTTPGGAILTPGRMAVSELGIGSGGDGAPVDEAAAAAAAVRALAARFGTVLPAEGLLEAEAELAFRERSRRLIDALVTANPAAYHEEAAEAAEAAYRALSERAKFRLRVLLQEASTGEAPWRQLEESLRELTSQRPFFLPPVLPRPKYERPQLEAPKAPKPIAWSADDSLFAQRKKENEARDLYDTDKIRAAQLLLDWKRITSKMRFRRMIARGDSGVRHDGQPLEEEIGEVREELERQADFIRSTFTYYSMLGGQGTSSDVLQINAGSWLAFCHDAGIVQPGAARGCTAADMQMVFVAVNFEEESETVEADANDDDAMVRFEFMEGLVRAAFGKYIASKRMTDASDAVGALLEEISASPNLPPEARVDANTFRRTRFYTPEVEAVLKEYYDLLVACFKLYKARDRAKYFWPEHWFAFLEANQLLGLATGVERREAKLIYAWSQAVVTDELRRRQRAVSLTLWDFIEAVARLADLISPPDHEDIIEFFLDEGAEPPELERLAWEYYKLVGDAGTQLKRASAELVAAPTRPLAPKLRLLLQYLTCSLREAWGGRDAKEVAAKVSKMATYLSGGIEMG